MFDCPRGLKSTQLPNVEYDNKFMSARVVIYHHQNRSRSYALSLALYMRRFIEYESSTPD